MMKRFDTNLIRMLILASFILVLAVAEGRAAQPYQPVHSDPVLEPWRWRSFPELKGLGLRCLAEAKDGAIWFGTDEGVRRYDGITWTTYTPDDGLLGAPVNVLCTTRDGSVYAGTDQGVSRFGEGGWSRAFPPEGDLPWPIDDLMEATDGSIWAGTAWGALRISPEGAVLYTTEEMGAALRTIAPWVQVSFVPQEAAPAYAWVGGIGVGIAERWYPAVPRGHVPVVIGSLAPGGPAEAAGLKVGDRMTAVDGYPIVTPEQLIGPAGSALTLTVRRDGRPDPFEVTVTRKQVEGTFRDFSVYDVYEGRDRSMWFGLSGGQIVRYDIRRAQSGDAAAWRLYTEVDGLSIGRRPKIGQTRDGMVWTVSNAILGGVNRFDGQVWTSASLSVLGGSDIHTSILETGDGTLWIGGKGLYAFRDGVWRVYDVSVMPVLSKRIRLLEASDGALWVAGLGQEAARLDYGTSRWMTYEGLNFQCETPDAAQWFLSEDGGVVRCDPSTGATQSGKTWTRYGVDDGLMDAPVALLVTRKGMLWASGSHNSTAATARFDGRQWSVQTHPRLSWGINQKALYESSDGRLWFGAMVDLIPEREQLGGVLRFDPSAQESGKRWVHYTPPDAPPYVYGIGQTADGDLWFGGRALYRFDGQVWTQIVEPVALSATWTDVVYAGRKGGLWVGTRTYGVYHYDRKVWNHYDMQDGLAGNQVRALLQTDDGSVWVSTGKEISRFDGRSWTTYDLPSILTDIAEGGLRQSREGTLWINSHSKYWPRRSRPGTAGQNEPSYDLRTICYSFDTNPPETVIAMSLEEVSQPGNTILAWRGADPWRATPDEDLRYAWRLDGGGWSPFSPEKERVFLSLPGGSHTFEVKARDQDFNEDPTPAVLNFTVVPPVWRVPWFVGLVTAFVGITGVQAVRILASNRNLKRSNAAQSAANRMLFELNEELQKKTGELEGEIHDRKQAQVELARSNAELEQFAYVASHDLQEPLRVTTGYLQLLERRYKGKLDTDANRFITRAVDGMARMKTLIDDLLAYSRVGTRGKPFEPTDCSDILKQVLHNLKVAVEESEALVTYDALPTVRVDATQLTQLFQNLIGNAIKFHSEEPPEIHIGAEHTDGEWLFSVRDNGIGIDPEYAERIFLIFQRLHTRGEFPGTGIGLAVCKKIVERHGGRLWVVSELEKGSTFYFTLPDRGGKPA